MSSQSQAQVAQRKHALRTPLSYLNNAPSVPAWPSKVFSDSCDLKTYQDDNNLAEDGWSPDPDSLIRMGNYFPLDSGTTGVIKSIDMYFSSNQISTAQSCIVYFYKADQTTILGQSESFINTGATWPDGTWVHVLCPDIPYTGPFYAMVDYSTDSVLRKNYFDSYSCPYDFAFVDSEGSWSHAFIFFGSDCDITFLQRINICEYSPVGIKTLTLPSISVYPNPAKNVVNIVSAEDINKIEIFDFLGQSIYKTIDIKLKTSKIDVTGFSAGQYFVKVITRNGAEIKKISVKH
jgi:hypothetical protein